MKAEIEKGVMAEKITALMEEIYPEKEGKKRNREIAEVEDIAETKRIPETIEVSAERENREQETVTTVKREVEEEIVRDQRAGNVPQIGGDEILGVTGARTGDDLDLTVEEGDREKGHIVVIM